ncbi:MAG TPA: hypothetical protein VH640_11715 [Bryobacteraceae bacterium]|jgi:hypothetical protein
MDAFLRDAEQILETAVAAGNGPAEHLIAILRTGSIRLLSDVSGWSLPALAAEYGATAVYRVTRRGRLARVEAWSLGRTCVLTRELTGIVRAVTPVELSRRAFLTRFC